MKKVICFVGTSLLLISIISMACVSTKIKPEAITNYNMCLLKGKWEGSSTFGSVANSIQVPTTMEIYNETVPLKGKLTMHNVPRTLLTQLNQLPAKPTPSGDVTFEFRDGNINEQGNFMSNQRENHIELTLKIGGAKLRMDGLIHLSSLNSSVTLSR